MFIIFYALLPLKTESCLKENLLDVLGAGPQPHSSVPGCMDLSMTAVSLDAWTSASQLYHWMPGPQPHSSVPGCLDLSITAVSLAAWTSASQLYPWMPGPQHHSRIPGCLSYGTACSGVNILFSLLCFPQERGNPLESLYTRVNTSKCKKAWCL